MGDPPRYFITCDFDGTVTSEDTLDLLVQRFAPGVWETMESGLLSGELSLTQVMEEEFRRLRVTEREAVEYVLGRARVRDGFAEFVRWAADRGHELVIVSAGIRTLIDPILAAAGLPYLHVHAGDALFTTEGALVCFPPSTAQCIDQCGHCKRDTILAHAPFPGPLVYVGDGYSDFCPTRQADIVFARASLATHLRGEGIFFHPFDDFHTIVSTLEGCGE
ncbi:MAG TPA: MtnX-like HAD-IB family phosphatase [Thermoleophilia bacterium]|nr:MtnX-like HAD-IB family phosphatase [Thermoleophilia bacterium]